MRIFGRGPKTNVALMALMISLIVESSSAEARRGGMSRENKTETVAKKMTREGKGAQRVTTLYIQRFNLFS